MDGVSTLGMGARTRPLAAGCMVFSLGWTVNDGSEGTTDPPPDGCLRPRYPPGPNGPPMSGITEPTGYNHEEASFKKLEQEQLIKEAFAPSAGKSARASSRPRAQN